MVHEGNSAISTCCTRETPSSLKRVLHDLRHRARHVQQLQTCWQVVDDSQKRLPCHERQHGVYHWETISRAQDGGRKRSSYAVVLSNGSNLTNGTKFTLHIQFRSLAHVRVRVYCMHYDFITPGRAGSPLTTRLMAAAKRRLFQTSAYLEIKSSSAWKCSHRPLSVPKFPAGQRWISFSIVLLGTIRKLE